MPYVVFTCILYRIGAHAPPQYSPNILSCSSIRKAVIAALPIEFHDLLKLKLKLLHVVQTVGQQHAFPHNDSVKGLLSNRVVRAVHQSRGGARNTAGGRPPPADGALLPLENMYGTYPAGDAAVRAVVVAGSSCHVL
jgi:hypothetical protein